MKKCLFLMALILGINGAYAQDKVVRVASASWVLYLNKKMDPELLVRVDDDNRLDFPYSYQDQNFPPITGKNFTMLLKGAGTKAYEIKVKVAQNKLTSVGNAHDSEIFLSGRLNNFALTNNYQTILAPAKNIKILDVPNRVDPLGYSMSSGKLSFAVDKISKASDPNVLLKPRDLPEGMWTGDIELSFQSSWN